MEFEWDPEKDRANKEKHGISFEEATAIWSEAHLEIEEIARSQDGEIRSATMGWVRDKIYLAIWTKRKSKIRIISTRRVRKNEEKIFFEKIQDKR